MWGAVKDKFRLSSEDKLMKTAVYKQLNNHYRNFRNRLHTKYYLPHKTMECALQHYPPEVDETQWKTLCEFFNSDDFKKRSAKTRRTGQNKPLSMLVGVVDLFDASINWLLLKIRTIIFLAWLNCGRLYIRAQKKKIGLMRKLEKIKRKPI